MKQAERLKAMFDAGKYFCDLSGQIYSRVNVGGRTLSSYVDPSKARPIKYSKNSRGYYTCTLTDLKGSLVYLSVHSTVALYWFGHPQGYQVNHIDGNKLNNDISNLEYVTRSENILHAYRTGLAKKGYFVTAPKLSITQVLEIRSSKLQNKELVKMYNVSKSCITSIKSGRSWRHI